MHLGGVEKPKFRYSGQGRASIGGGVVIVKAEKWNITAPDSKAG